MAPQVESFKPQTTDDTGSHAASTAMLNEVQSSVPKDAPAAQRPVEEPQVLDFGTHNIYGDNVPLSPATGGEDPHDGPEKPSCDVPPPKPMTELPDGWKQQPQEGNNPIVLQSPSGERIQLPDGAKDVQIKDGKATYNQNGVTVDLDQNGKPVAYHSNGFSFEYHSDVDKWYYHQDSGGDYVQIDVPNVTADGSVHTREHGGFNSGREHHLVASGQVTEGMLDHIEDNLRHVGFNPDAAFVEGFYPFLGDVNGRKPTVVNAVSDNGGFIGGGADDAAKWDADYRAATGRADIIDHPKNLSEMVDKLLESGQPLGNVVIETHGSPGTIYIGDQAYRLDDPEVVAQFARLNGHMENGARIVFRGCEIGHGDDAQNQLQGIANAAGAEVQAFSWVQVGVIPGYGPNIVAKPWPTN